MAECYLRLKHLTILPFVMFFPHVADFSSQPTTTGSPKTPKETTNTIFPKILSWKVAFNCWASGSGWWSEIHWCDTRTAWSQAGNPNGLMTHWWPSLRHYWGWACQQKTCRKSCTIVPLICTQKSTPPKTNMSFEKKVVESYLPFEMALFYGTC